MVFISTSKLQLTQRVKMLYTNIINRWWHFCYGYCCKVWFWESPGVCVLRLDHKLMQMFHESLPKLCFSESFYKFISTFTQMFPLIRVYFQLNIHKHGSLLLLWLQCRPWEAGGNWLLFTWKSKKHENQNEITPPLTLSLRKKKVLYRLSRFC